MVTRMMTWKSDGFLCVIADDASKDWIALEEHSAHLVPQIAWFVVGAPSASVQASLILLKYIVTNFLAYSSLTLYAYYSARDISLYLWTNGRMQTLPCNVGQIRLQFTQ